MKKVNRSELIREHLRVAKDKSPVAVVEALAKKGVKVSTGLVSVVKHTRRAKLTNHAKAKKKTSAFVRRTLAKHSSALAEARRFVEHAGGVEEAQSLIQIVGEIMG